MHIPKINLTNKTKKILLIVSGVLTVVLTVAIIYFSHIVKYLVEKYDVQYTGREIKLSGVYANPLTGYLNFKGVEIHEENSDSIFISAKNISADVSVFKLFFKTYELTDVTFNEPNAVIIKNKKIYNFSDVIEKINGKKDSMESDKAIHFNIINAKINNGELHFKENVIPIDYFIKNVNIASKGKKWDTDSIAGQFSFASGIGTGDAKGDFMINIKNNDYRLAASVQKFDLDIIQQYMKDLTNYGSFSATLDADLKSSGNLLIRENVTNSGKIAINDFHFGKNPKEDYFSFDKFSIGITEISPSKKVYMYDSVTLLKPYFKYEKYDYLDNFQMIFGENGSKFNAARADKEQFNLVVEIADYLKMLSNNLFTSPYKVNRLAIQKADLQFNDFSRNEKFSASLNPLNIRADSINKAKNRVKIYLDSDIQPYGNATMTLSMNPRDSSDFEAIYKFEKIPASLFNPYIVTYTSFPLDRGTLEVNGNWRVIDGKINSDNHLLLLDPRANKRVKNKGSKWIPLPLVLAFVRERSNAIDYKLPITGDLKNPKFQLKDVFRDLVRNIFVKPPTTPYGLEVTGLERKIEKLLTLQWRSRQTELVRNQRKFLEKVADFLKKEPQSSIKIQPQIYAEKEKEHILFYEAKKKYYSAIHNKKESTYTEKDSSTVDKMSIRDASFLAYINKKIGGAKTALTIQDKCKKFLNSDIVNIQFAKINKTRTDALADYFKERGVNNQVKIASGENVIPYNGFTFFRIEYSGELPPDLVEAYDKLDEYDSEPPREKFKEERQKNRRLLDWFKKKP